MFWDGRYIVMTFEQLEYFLTTAKYLNLSKAASELYVSHSAISKSISSLEEELGTYLFERRNNVLSLTPSGAYLQKQGAYILQIWHTTKQQLRIIENSVSGTVTLVLPAIFETKLFSAIVEMGQNHPEINFIFNSEDPLLILTMLKNKRADIGIVFSYQIDELDSEIEYRYLFNDSFCVVVNNKHPLAAKESVRLDDLKNELLVFPPKRINIEPKFAPLQKFLDYDYHNIYQANGLDELFFQIAINKGISILPKGTLQGRSLDFTTLPIQDIEDTYYTCLVWEKNNTNPVIPFVVDKILSQFQMDSLT